MLRIFLPGVKTGMVEQAVKKICQEGNIDNMEKILGLSSQMIVGSEEEFLMTESNDIVPNTDIGEQQNDLVKSEHKATEDPLDNIFKVLNKL